MVTLSAAPVARATSSRCDERLRAEPFHHPPKALKCPGVTCRSGETTNRFDLQYWEGAREAALAIYEYVNDRKDVPEDVRVYVTRVLKESGERKNKGFREELGLAPAIVPRAKAR